MIARFFILLPFDLFITESDPLSAMDVTSPDHRIRVYPPILYAERPKPTDSLLAQGLRKLSPPSFSENLLVNGRKVAQVNVLTVDFIKAGFDRSTLPHTPPDPKPELAFEIANEILARIRVYSRAFQIKPLVIGRDPWRLQYLTDDSQELEFEEGKARGRGGFSSSVGVVALTPETIQLLATHWQRAEPYVWDQLLLDAQGLLPDVGSAIVMASAALEIFIGWALDILQKERPLPQKLWNWIKERNDEHWIKSPSVSEKYDDLLYVFTGKSLKEEAHLWQRFTELRKARNALAHEGVAAVAGKPVDSLKAKELVDSADKIIAWVEVLLPEAHRRIRIAATDLCARRVATPQEADTLGVTHIESGQFGPLPPGGGIAFRFEPKPHVEPAAKPDDEP